MQKTVQSSVQLSDIRLLSFYLQYEFCKLSMQCIAVPVIPLCSAPACNGGLVEYM